MHKHTHTELAYFHSSLQICCCYVCTYDKKVGINASKHMCVGRPRTHWVNLCFCLIYFHNRIYQMLNVVKWVRAISPCCVNLLLWDAQGNALASLALHLCWLPLFLWPSSLDCSWPTTALPCFHQLLGLQGLCFITTSVGVTGFLFLVCFFYCCCAFVFSEPFSGI